MSDDDERPRIPKGQSAAARRASLLFLNAIRGATKSDCRFTYGGIVPASGVPRVRTSCIGQRFEDWQRCCHRHWWKARLLKTDRIVATCGNPLCGDKRHLWAIPAPKLPKVARPARVKIADVLAAVAADAAAAAALDATTLLPPPSITVAGP